MTKAEIQQQQLTAAVAENLSNNRSQLHVFVSADVDFYIMSYFITGLMYCWGLVVQADLHSLSITKRQRVGQPPLQGRVEL